MKAKMTVYQNGGKMPVDPTKAELAKKLFGEIPKYDKAQFKKGMMGEKLKTLQKEYDYWVNRGERTAASGVKVQMDKIREDIKKFSNGGMVAKYKEGGKLPIVPDPKKNIPDPKKEGTGLYFESKTGRVGRTYPLYGSAVEVQSMDTTGYGAGRKDFKLETSRPGSSKSSSPVKREDVLKTINKLKSGASRVAKFKNGGKMNVAGAKGADQYKYLGYGKKK